MERYRSGHNEAVLKTVCRKGAWVRIPLSPFTRKSETSNNIESNELGILEKYPSAEGRPWKGCRSGNGARVQIPLSPLFFMKIDLKNF